MFRGSPAKASVEHAVATPCGTLVAVFSRDERLYTHRIEMRRGPVEPVVLLRAASGRDPQNPDSPPLHGLNVDDLGYSPRPLPTQAKLIGVSTDRSWKVALGPDPLADDRLLYEASCRLATAAPEVRSSYHTPRARLLSGSSQAATFRTAGVCWTLRLRNEVEATRSPFCRIELPNTLAWNSRPAVAVVAEPAISDQPPMKLSWRFEIALGDMRWP
ncbi:hypothetical protein KOR34_49630 [Posidoniimonas corsicana]|uniref:Uncharacterized protein n=1 Tax=Posidoniimonas corsicana TaxID=1938618 RepID=A0A5C5UVK3_9BACT|nr:hypothetical protein [Posidoniimonas corsicana]TWT30404.1 hypothetical protein KOR34_49630 [Posidoniimonas corsicana]